MLFHLAYVQILGGLLPPIIRTVTKIGFGIDAATKVPGAAFVDINVIFTPEELNTFRKSHDVEELRRLHRTAVERGEQNDGDDFCKHCMHARTTVMRHCFNGQMILSQEQWKEIDETTSAKQYRKLIALGRRNATDFRGLYRNAVLGFDACPACGASRSAKSLQKAA